MVARRLWTRHWWDVSRAGSEAVTSLADIVEVYIREHVIPPEHDGGVPGRDVVLLLDVAGSERAMKPRNVYVAASRPRLRLHVFARDGVDLPGRGYATL